MHSFLRKWGREVRGIYLEINCETKKPLPVREVALISFEILFLN